MKNSRLLCCILFLVLYSLIPLFGAEKKILMVMWRGETQCEKGFCQYLLEHQPEITIKKVNARENLKKLDRIVQSINEDEYDLIYTFGTTVTKKVSARIKQTPVLFGIVAAPVKAGIIANWKNSGNNLTGVSHVIPYTEQVRFIQKAFSPRKIGMIYNSRELNSQITNKELKKLLDLQGVELVSIGVTNKKELDYAIQDLGRKKIDLLYLPSDSYMITHNEKLLKTVNRKKIPSYGAVEEHVKKGALIGLISSYFTVGQEVAKKAVAVLNGKRPSSIPTHRLDYSQQLVVINRKTMDMVQVALPEDCTDKARYLGACKVASPKKVKINESKQDVK